MIDMSRFTKDYFRYHMKEYARQVYLYGFQKMPPDYELKLIALYMRDELEMDNETIRNKLIGFCQKWKPDTPHRAWALAISKAINYIKPKERVLIEVPYVDMYEEEIAYIDDLDISDNGKRVIFTMMVQKKLDKYCYEMRNANSYKIFTYDSTRIKKLKSIAKLHNVKDVSKEVLHELYCHRLIDFIECRNTPIKLNFAERILDEGSFAVRVSDYSKIGQYWDWIHGNKRVGVCAVCWKVFSIKGTCQVKQYCDEHNPRLGVADRIVKCIDCGQEFVVDHRNTRTIRCEQCKVKKQKS